MNIMVVEHRMPSDVQPPGVVKPNPPLGPAAARLKSRNRFLLSITMLLCSPDHKMISWWREQCASDVEEVRPRVCMQTVTSNRSIRMVSSCMCFDEFGFFCVFSWISKIELNQSFLFFVDCYGLAVKTGNIGLQKFFCFFSKICFG